ncbi:MAG: ribonuclease P protein component 4 [Nanoarchaeota archaeon]|nr:ribonuclease P protein component 4 [Nanoarchaeota archaeon]
MSRKVPRAKVQSIAKERIEKLFEEAEAAFAKHPERSDRYAQLAWAISTKNKLRMPRELKRKFCRHCKSFWMPGKTVRVRTQEGHVVFTCLVCKHQTRVPY